MRGYVRSPDARYYTQSVQQTIQLNASLNAQAQASIDAKEPTVSIWDNDLESSMAKLNMGSKPSGKMDEKSRSSEKGQINKRASIALSKDEKSQSSEKGQINKRASIALSTNGEASKTSRFAGFKKALNIKSTEEKAVAKVSKVMRRGHELRELILTEENGRWPDVQWRQIVAAYQDKVGMTRKIAHLRAHQPTQYLHLLRAGYFEPIPVAWATQNSNPLKFSIEAASGWRGITPAWRGYEDTAEERLYWVLNHREGSTGARLKPDFISAMNMARQRMASAVEPPPMYYSPNDTCHTQHTSDGYSKQVMPAPFSPIDAPEVSTDDTMILLDVSGSMDFDPVRPNYNQYLITGYSNSTQPKNKGMPQFLP